MPHEILLGVVDQSVLRKGAKASEALAETVRLAQAVEQFGYARYWVAEHHNSTSFTGNAPEILIGQIAASTSSIRVGSGGVMLPHYSALKVAEQFRMLDALHPGRIELGIGRAPGSDRLTAAALTFPRPPIDINRFPQMVTDLLGFLHGRLESDHPFSEIRVQAGVQPESAPDVWVLGSSDFSARLAALLGLPFSFADFFGNTGGHGPLVADLYREQFKPSEYLSEPRMNVAVQALCAPTEEEAQFLASSRNLNKAAQHLNLKEGLLPPKEASQYQLPSVAGQYIESLKPSYIDGEPGQVRDKILELAGRYGTSEVSVVTTCYSYQDRERSYELIAEAFGVRRVPADAGEQSNP